MHLAAQSAGLLMLPCCSSDTGLLLSLLGHVELSIVSTFHDFAATRAVALPLARQQRSDVKRAHRLLELQFRTQCALRRCVKIWCMLRPRVALCSFSSHRAMHGPRRASQVPGWLLYRYVHSRAQGMVCSAELFWYTKAQKCYDHTAANAYMYKCSRS